MSNGETDVFKTNYLNELVLEFTGNII